tara:strand:- start:14966 stop:15364 length:399 start_codon:yes stop_codon:yes gene_type:complete
MQRTKKQCQECGADYFQYNSLQKYCSPECTYKNAKATPQKRKRIKYVGEKRKLETGIYLARRTHFLNRPENKWCPVFPHLNTTEVHHKKGRVGSLYLDESYWLAVSRKGHQKIEMNPDWAKEKGFSVNRLSK